MKTIAAIALGAALFAVPFAHAQSSISNGPPPNLKGVTPAPVGHRQPKATDVPKNDTQADLDAADRALDKKIRSICRGC